VGYRFRAFDRFRVFCQDKKILGFGVCSGGGIGLELLIVGRYFVRVEKSLWKPC
jgi:hypothetical protein